MKGDMFDMSLEEQLRQKIKSEVKIRVAIGIVGCAVLIALMIVIVINRANEVENGTSDSTWSNLGISVVSIISVALFIRNVPLAIMNAKKDLASDHEIVKIVVLRSSMRMSLMFKTWEASALVENLETNEQTELDGCGDLKENERYYMIIAKHTKQVAYQLLDDTPLKK